MNTNSFFSEKLYLGTLYVWITYFSLLITTYFEADAGFPNIYRPMLFLTILVLLVKELIDFPRTFREFIEEPSKIIVLIVFVLIMLIRARNRDALFDINAFMLAFSARNIHYKKLLGVFSLATFTVLFLTVLATSRGILSNMYQNSDRGYRFALGFRYVSFASQRMFFGLASYVMYRGRRITYLEILLLFWATSYFYGQTATTSPYYLSLLLLGYVLIFHKFFNKNLILDSRILSFAARWSYVLGSAILLYFIFFASAETTQLIDQFVNNRLRLSIGGFREYGVSLLGRKISFTTFDIFGNFSSNYDFIDSSIIQAMVLDGMIYYLFFAVYSFQKVAQYFINLRKDIVVAGIAIMVIHGMFDPQLLVLYYSPMLLLISRIFTVDVENVDGVRENE